MPEKEVISVTDSLIVELLRNLIIISVITVPVIWKLFKTSPICRFYIKLLFYEAMVIATGFLLIPCCLFDPFNPENCRKYGTWVFLRVLRTADILGLRIVHRGFENFNIDGPFIVVSNHQSSLDLIPMFDSLPKRCTAMGKRELLFAGPFGIAALLCGGMLIDRRPGKSREAMDQAVKNIKENNVRLWIFAEGTRNHKDGFLPFKKGAFHLALQAGIPVVPAVITSYSHFYNKSKAKFDDGELIVTVLPPVPSTKYTIETINDFVEDVRGKMLTVFEESSAEARERASSESLKYE